MSAHAEAVITAGLRPDLFAGRGVLTNSRTLVLTALIVLVVAGFGDLRQVELLVEAGFTPVEAIKIASFNGAKFLGEDARIGSIAPGKQADLLLVNGDPSRKIADIEKIETVFKKGLGYDSQKLIDSVRGQVGIR